MHMSTLLPAVGSSRWWVGTPLTLPCDSVSAWQAGPLTADSEAWPGGCCCCLPRLTRGCPALSRLAAYEEQTGVVRHHNERLTLEVEAMKERGDLKQAHHDTVVSALQPLEAAQ